MNTNVQIIQTELQRRFSLTYQETKNKMGEVLLVLNFPRVYDYIDYIETNEILNQLMYEENQRCMDYALWSLNTDKNKPKHPPKGTDRALNQWYNYSDLLMDVYEKIYRLNNNPRPFNNNLWGIAYMFSPKAILEMNLPFLTKLKLILIRVRRGEHEFQQKIKDKLCAVHYRMLNLLAEYDDRPNSEKEPKPRDPVLKQIGINSETNWQDITISFKSEFEIKVKHKKQEIDLTHEHLGFADRRMSELTRAKSSWELLRLLAIGNGVFPLGKLSRKDRTKRKKQKQELSRLLKKYFQIDDDPFYELDKDKMEYKIKLQLIPEKEFKDDWKDRNIYEDTEKQGTSFLIDV